MSGLGALSWAAWLVVALGAAIGAPLRYAVDRWAFGLTAATSQSRSAWLRQPWGLVIVNVGGSAIAGIALAATDGNARMLLAVGFCGSLTTFSSFGWAAVTSWSSDRRAFWAGLLVMTAGCIAAFAAAFYSVSAMAG